MEVVLAVVKARGTIKPTITVAVLALSQETKISTSETSIPKIHALFIDNMITFGENASLTQRMPSTMVAVEAEEGAAHHLEEQLVGLEAAEPDVVGL